MNRTMYVGSKRPIALDVPRERLTSVPLESILQAARGYGHILIARHCVTGDPLGWIASADIGQGSAFTAKDAVSLGMAIIDWPENASGR